MEEVLVMNLEELYWKIRAWISDWTSYVKFKLQKAETRTKPAKQDIEFILLNPSKADLERCKLQIQLDVAKVRREDAVQEILRTEIYANFGNWLRNEIRNQRNSKKS